MPLSTLDRTPPPLFRQGASARSKLMLLSALALLLMVADARWTLARPLRSALVTVLHPVQWLALQPVHWMQRGGQYIQDLEQAQTERDGLRKELVTQTVRSSEVEQLKLENERLRALVGLKDRLPPQALSAQVLYDAADPYTQRMILDKGMLEGVQEGSSVVDEGGVLGQITRVHPLVSEITLLTDRDQAIPVLNARTGVRSVAYGMGGSELELRFTAGNADVQEGDLLTTSGIDGIYPPGLHVATVSRIERRAESSFARVLCTPFARMRNAFHVIIMAPTGSSWPERPQLTPSRGDGLPPGAGRPGTPHTSHRKKGSTP